MYEELVKRLREADEKSMCGECGLNLHTGATKKGVLFAEAADAIEDLSEQISEQEVTPEAEHFIDKYADRILGELQELKGSIKDKPRWIPVTERLPEDNCRVLAYYGFDRGDGYLGMMFMQVLDYYARDPAPHFQHEGLNGMKVTHWMPLPPEPKKETPAEDINVPGTYDILYEEGGPDTR